MDLDLSNLPSNLPATPLRNELTGTNADNNSIPGDYASITLPAAADDDIPADLTMDDIWSQGVQQDKVDAAAKEMLLARGPYLTAPPLTVAGQRYPEEKGGRPARTIFRAYGFVAWAGQTIPETGSLKGWISFVFSPDEVRTARRDGRVDLDLASKLYVKLVKAFTRAYARSPETILELKSYLESTPVKLTIGVTTDGRNMVFGLSHPV